MISISILAAQYRCLETTMYKSERELKSNDLFISAWCVLLWDSYKIRIVTSSFQFFLALFQRGRLFRFIWQKKIFLLSCSESTIYDAQSSSSSFMISIIGFWEELIVPRVWSSHFTLTYTNFSHFSLLILSVSSSKKALRILYYLLSIHITLHYICCL